MRLVFPFATISAIVFASRAKAKSTEVTALKSQVARGNVKGGAPSSTLIGNECNPSIASNNNANTLHLAKRSKAAADVGILASGSHPSCYDQSKSVCIPDKSSTLGGRCHYTSKEISISPKHRRFLHQSTTNRFLKEEEEEEPFVCPAKTCPAELCECAASTEYGWPDAQDCATELHAVCTSASTENGISDCFNDEYAAFYEEVYCEFASCWLNGNSYEDCDCGYYVNYCTLYEDYADGYPEVAEKCEVAGCCKEASGSVEKILCVPGLNESLAALEEVVVVNQTAGMLNGTVGSLAALDEAVVNRTVGMLNGTVDDIAQNITGGPTTTTQTVDGIAQNVTTFNGTADGIAQNMTAETTSTPPPFELETFGMSNDMPLTENTTGSLSPTDSPWVDMSTSAFGITPEPTSAPTGNSSDATPLSFSSIKQGGLENGDFATRSGHISSWIMTMALVGGFWILA